MTGSGFPAARRICRTKFGEITYSCGWGIWPSTSGHGLLPWEEGIRDAINLGVFSPDFSTLIIKFEATNQIETCRTYLAMLHEIVHKIGLKLQPESRSSQSWRRICSLQSNNTFVEYLTWVENLGSSTTCRPSCTARQTGRFHAVGTISLPSLHRRNHGHTCLPYWLKRPIGTQQHVCTSKTPDPHT